MHNANKEIRDFKKKSSRIKTFKNAKQNSKPDATDSPHSTSNNNIKGFLFKMEDEDILYPPMNVEATSAMSTNQNSILASQGIDPYDTLGEPFPLQSTHQFVPTPPQLFAAGCDSYSDDVLEGGVIIHDPDRNEHVKGYVIQCKSNVEDLSSALLLEHRSRLNKLRMKFTDDEYIFEFQKLEAIANALHSKAELNNNIRQFIQRYRQNYLAFQMAIDTNKKRNTRTRKHTTNRRNLKCQGFKIKTKSKSTIDLKNSSIVKVLSDNFRKIITRLKSDSKDSDRNRPQ